MAEKRRKRPSRKSSVITEPRVGLPLPTPAESRVDEGAQEQLASDKTHSTDRIIMSEVNELNPEQTSIHQGRLIMSAETTSEATTSGTLADAGQAVKDNVVGGLKGIQQIETETVGVLEHAVEDTLKATRSVAVEGVTAIKDVATGAIQAIADVGTGFTGGAKNLASGLVSGVSDVGGEVFSVAYRAARGVVSSVAELGTDVGAVAGKTANGVITLAQEVGGNVGTVARSAAEGTIDALRTVGTEAVKAVSVVLVTTVQGVKDVLNAALPQR